MSERRGRPRAAAQVVLVLGGVVLLILAGVMFGASLLAIDPEDEVPFVWWLLPLLVGAASIVLGIRLTPRSPHRSPPGGW